MIIASKKYKNKNIAILGLGNTGISAINTFLSAQAKVYAWDDSKKLHLKAKLLGAIILDLSSNSWPPIDLLFVSPGIPLKYPKPHPAICEAKSKKIRITSDIEIFYESLKEQNFFPKIIGVTGTNGKSTVTAMISHALGGFAAGNIGKPVLELNIKDKLPIVLELSSYQLDLISKFKSFISVLLNISPDHLIRHGNLKNYLAAKRRLFKNQNKNDYAIFAFDDPLARRESQKLECVINCPKVIPVSLKKFFSNGVYINKNGDLVDNLFKDKFIYKSYTNKLQILGVHNLYNSLIAYTACRLTSLEPKIIISKLFSFRGLPHRMEKVAEIQGVSFYDDSKATNVAATDAALYNFNKVILITGGQYKGEKLDPLLDHAKRLFGVFLIGESKHIFAKAFSSVTKVKVSNTINNAVKDAYIKALEQTPSPSILLSPAAASFDQFKDFEERGIAFQKAVNKLSEAG